MFAGFCGHADKNHIYTVLTVTTGPLRANIMLVWPSVKMSLTACYSAGLPTCLHQRKPDLVPKKARKSQIAVLRHIHIKHA